MLFLTFNAVHLPAQATEKYLERFTQIEDEKRRTYAAMLSALDDNVGRCSTSCTTAKLDNDTLVFFISDNGGPPANGSHNDPLNGRKATVWEGGVRVPFLLRWNGHVPAGHRLRAARDLARHSRHDCRGWPARSSAMASRSTATNLLPYVSR